MLSRQIQLLMMMLNKMVYPKILFKGYKKTVSNDVGKEKADEMEGSSVILGEQNIVHDGEIFIQDHLTTVDFNNDEDQTSKFKDVEWNDDSDCGYGDNSEVENEFSDSSAKPSTKHIKKIKQEVQKCCG